ncbi:MAG: lipocalin family protein [Chitinivibrionales bacterium]|nr:lipocalin family protein [Chitinivibrionales bacterium]
MLAKYSVFILKMVFCGALIMNGIAAGSSQRYKPVDNFSLERYLGTWYEIVRYPHPFEKGLSRVSATYTQKDDGTVRVENAGYKNDKLSRATGKAKMAGAPSVGHLKVSFFLFFYDDYIIVELAPDYSHAIVTSNSSDYLWILSRTPKMDRQVFDRLVARAVELGFSREKMIFVQQ